LRAHHAVIAADSGHIADNETGAVEASGHKVITVPAENGKLSPAAVLPALSRYGDERRPKPKLVYISNSTETGTVYTKSELAALSGFCRENGMYLYLDGARLSQALASGASDLDLPRVASMCDAFYFGGTKNGLL